MHKVRLKQISPLARASRAPTGARARARVRADVAEVCVRVYVRVRCVCAAVAAQGDKQWGKDMQNDITDTVRWAIAQGWADPAKICA